MKNGHAVNEEQLHDHLMYQNYSVAGNKIFSVKIS